MNCQPCSENLAAAFKRMRGVESVDIDLKDGTVSLKFAAQNRLGPEQVWDAIKRVGFTPGISDVKVRGSVQDGKLQVPESGKIFALEGRAENADSVEIRGTTAPPPDPRTPISIKIAP
jgi:copper chaperone CopZ